MSPKTNDFGCFNDKKVPHYKQSTMHAMLLELYNGAGLQESLSFVLKGITRISVLILTCSWNDGGSTKKLDNQQCLIFSNMFKLKGQGPVVQRADITIQHIILDKNILCHPPERYLSHG